MTKKITKRVLLASVMSLILCFAMLLGTTYAWFTDSVTSGGNVIKSGNLNIDLLVKKDGNYVSVKENKDAIFEYDLWEPGYTEVKNVKVETTGNLALKYTITITPKSATAEALKLAEVIDVYYAAEEVSVTDRNLTGLTKLGTLADVFNGKVAAISDTLIPGTNDADYATIALKMQETAGNEYQNLSVGGGFDIKVFATQYTYESDSFGNDYDANAPYILPVGVTAETFEANNALVYANGNYYATLNAAVEAAHNNGDAVIYCKPKADLGSIQHLHVCDNLTVYGNDAYISGPDFDFEVDTYQVFGSNSNKACAQTANDFTLNIYSLDGVAVWGQRTTERTINININDCQSMNRVYITGTKGTTNVNIDGCSFGGTGYNNTAVYTNNPGTINVSNTTINAYAVGINQNNKSAGVQNINLTNCEFVDCATATVAAKENATGYAAPVRVVASGEGAVTNLTITNCEYTYTTSETAVNGDVLTTDTRAGVTLNGTVNYNP